MQRVLLAVVCTLLFTGSMAQHQLLRTKFICKASEGTAHELLRELVSYCGINIDYSPSSLDNSQRIILTAGETTIGAVLNKILKAQRVAVIERNDKIIIAAATTPLPTGALLEHFVLFGFIQQEGSLEPLPFASVRETASTAGCETNIAGFYTMNLPAGIHRFEVSFTGFNTRIIEVDIQQNTRFNLTLSPAVLPEVQVSTGGNILKRDAGNNLDREQTGMYSNMLGETDPVRAVYLLPGNTESQETGGQFIVRGGEPGQSLFLLDGNQVFNPAHLLGEISIVNNTSIKSVKQYKNDFPGQFSGGISAITAIHTKDGNMKNWSGEGAIGLSSTSLTVEGPVKEQRSALMVSARRSLGDASNKDLFSYDALFTDLHLKLTTQLNKNNKLSISNYTGNDRLQLTQENSDYLQKWRNKLFTVNWNMVTGKRSFAYTALNVSMFNNYVAMKYSANYTPTGIPYTKYTVFNNYTSGRRYEAKTTIEITANPNWQFLFGGKYEHVDMQPYATLVTTIFEEDKKKYTSLPALSFDNFAAWYENVIRIGKNLLVRPGVHVNAYTTKAYNNQMVQPRLFASYRLNNKQQLSVSWSHMGQVLHQVTSPYPGINREIWLPANNQFQPALSKMINLGYQYKNSRLANISLDLYYKTIKHLVNFSETANVLFYNESIEKKLIAGKGFSYGTELVVERKFNKWKTLLSYTLSWSWRRFDSIHNGAKQPYRYDRRHNLNWLFSYQPVTKIEFSLLWHFHTGDWITVPELIPSNPEESMNKTDPASGTSTFTPYRGKVFNRININTTWYFKPWKMLNHKLNAGVHMMDNPPNAYNTRFSTPDNAKHDITLFPEQLFKYSWYISYIFSF